MEALAIEKKIHRQIYDNGLLSGTLLSQLNLFTNLKEDAVLADRLPPPQPTQFALEVRFLLFAIFVGEKLIPSSNRVAKWRDKIAVSREEFWMVSSYVGRELPDRLRQFFAVASLDPTIIEPCIKEYEELRVSAIAKLDELEHVNPGVIAKFQTKVGERVGILAQQEMIEKLVDSGNITESVGSQLLVAIDEK